MVEKFSTLKMAATGFPEMLTIRVRGISSWSLQNIEGLQHLCKQKAPDCTVKGSTGCLQAHESGRRRRFPDDARTDAGTPELRWQNTTLVSRKYCSRNRTNRETFFTRTKFWIMSTSFFRSFVCSELLQLCELMVAQGLRQLTQYWAPREHPFFEKLCLKISKDDR